MLSLYDVPAPAKLNLFLHVTGRRADGYHLLQSVFMLIDWADTLNFEVRHDGRISREDINVALPVDDLIIRAARALQEATHCPLGAHITIEKSIPAQAGMGGGSSDAASTLLALNRLWRLNLSVENLQSIGLKLGADVPFFLGGRNARVEGIGEKMTPLELPCAQFLVVKPGAGLNTALIFSDPELKRDSEPAIISGFATDAHFDMFDYGRNDLQVVAERLCPAVTLAIEWLGLQGLKGRMTGSGSAVFAHLPDGRAGIDWTGLQKPASIMQVRSCKSLPSHPLLGWADSDREISV